MKLRNAGWVLSFVCNCLLVSQAYAVPPKLSPEPSPPIPVRPASTPEFFALLDYSRFPVLAPIQTAVLARNYDAAKVELLDYMRDRKARWTASMPGYTPPTYYYDAKNDWGALRQLQAEEEERARTEWNANPFLAGQVFPDTIALASPWIEYKFNFQGACCWQGENINWTVTTPECLPDDSTIPPPPPLQASCGATSANLNFMSSWGWVGYVAKAYLVTGDVKYSNYLVDRIMIDFAREVPVNSGVTTPWFPTQTAARLPMLLDGYFLTLGSPSMTPQKNYEILSLIFAHGEYFANYIETNGAGDSDENANVAAGAMTLGVLFPEFLTKDFIPNTTYEACWTTGSAPKFRGSRVWLRKGLQWLEAALIDGGYKKPLGFQWYFDWVPKSFGDSGWSPLFSTFYHRGNLRRLTGALQLLDRNSTLRAPLPSDVGQTRLVTDSDYFQLSQGTLDQSIPGRARRMMEVMYQNTAPDGRVLPNGDGPLVDIHQPLDDIVGDDPVLALGVVTFGDARWKSRASIPPWETSGVEGRGKFEGIVANDAGYTSFQQSGSNFMMMHSDSVNRAAESPLSPIDSQFLFFDANSTATPEHAHHDICQIQFFSHGHHMLIDPTGKMQTPEGLLVGPQYHNTSVPNNLVYAGALVGTIKGPILPGALVHEFTPAHGMTVARASLTNGSSDATPVETRTVVYFPNEYAIVADLYPPCSAASPGSCPSSPSGPNATTYWHLGDRAVHPKAQLTGPPSTPAPHASCTIGDSSTSTHLVQGGKTTFAKFFTANSFSVAHEASLFILPLHPEETAASIVEGYTEVSSSHFYTPTYRVLYEFDANAYPAREQVLFPQEATNCGIVPVLTALDPDDNVPRGKYASGFDLTVGDRRDVTMISHVASTSRGFGGEFETDAIVARLRYDAGVLSRITVKDASFIDSSAIGNEPVFDSNGKVEDLDALIAGSSLHIYASPNARTARIRAPLATSVFYNGIVYPFTKSGSYVTINMSTHATKLSIDPEVPLYAWQDAVFELDLTANDSNGHIAPDFNGSVTVTASPSTIQMSLDDFETILPNPATVTMTKSYAHLYLRGSAATTSSPASVTVSYSGSYGSLTTATKNDIHIDSLVTKPYTVTTTTLGGPTTTTTTTTTTLPREYAAYASFEGIETLSSPPWTNPGNGTQLWNTGFGNGNTGNGNDPGAQQVRFNSTDSLTLNLSLCGFRDIRVQWSRMTKQRNSGHALRLSWFNGTSWVQLEDVVGNSDWQTNAYSLPAIADGNTAFKVKIETLNTGSLALGFVDDLFVTGIPAR